MISSEADENDSAHPNEGPESLSAQTNVQLPRDKVDMSDRTNRGKPRKRRSAGEPGDVSRALRTVYDDTLREQVPDDFMDLLGKLS